MALAADQEVIQALAAYAAQEALAACIGLRGAYGRTQDADPACGGEAVEARPVLGVVVTDQEPGGRPAGRRLA